MDKNNNFLKWIIYIAFIIIVLFLIKSLHHKKEISILIEQEDLAQIYNNKNINSTNYNSEKQNEIISSSRKINKKTKMGKDFISNNEAINNENQNNAIDVSSMEIRNKFNYENNDFDLLSRLIYSEAGNQPYIGKIAVGNVVLYRSQQNNQSIEEVIYSKNQFDGVNTNSFNREPNAESKKAAVEVLSGVSIINDGYFFANLNLCSPNWAKEKTFICRIGDHWFFKKE